MNCIVGYEKEKAVIAQLKKMLKSAEEYHKLGVRIPRGLMLAGAPGIGKTKLAKSLLCKGVTMIELRAENCEFELAGKLHELFKCARKEAPSVVLLDELDKIAGESFFSTTSDKITKALIQEMDNLKDDDYVLVVATCNDLSDINEALLRPGRFDRILKMELPDEATRKRILKKYFSKLKLEKKVDLDELAKLTSGYSGAKLECVVNEVGILAMESEDRMVTQEMCNKVTNRIDFCATEKNAFEDSEQLRRVAIHEAGHVVTAMYLAPEILCGASILPQGEAQGFIRVADDEKHMKTISEVEAEAAIILGGHVAERIVLGENMLGSVSDLSTVSMRLHYMITREAAYGYEMLMCAPANPRMEIITPEVILEKISAKQAERISAIDKHAEEIICKNRAIFDAVVEALMEKKTLTREEIFDIKRRALKVA